MAENMLLCRIVEQDFERRYESTCRCLQLRWFAYVIQAVHRRQESGQPGDIAMRRVVSHDEIQEGVARWR